MRRLIPLLILLALAGAAPARAQGTDAVLDSIQYGAFRFFWNEANPANGLIKDRDTPGSACSIASTGFGLSALCIGVDHGWVARAAAAQRVKTTLNTFWTKPQGPAAAGVIGYKGLFYHFLDMNTGFRTWDCELSTIDTALLLAGIVDARQYFDGPDADEVQIRSLADSIVRRVDWKWAKNNGSGIRMGWLPTTGFQNFGVWVGYNEAMILYILALGAPDSTAKGATSSDWGIWTSGYNWATQYGQTYVIFPPLFGHQYSHCWVDFRDIRDFYMRTKGIDYFENSRRATLAQRAYCAANPLGYTGYSNLEWGITAGDGPSGYQARGAPPWQNDDGTITPTASISSIPFAPEVVVPTILTLWNTHRASLWGRYGFRDGYNLTDGWWATDVIGIDQGPEILMIENHLTGKVWQRVMADPVIQDGLRRAGFRAVAVGVEPPAEGSAGLELSAGPNPSPGPVRLSFTLPVAGPVRLAVFDVAGREVARLADGPRAAGGHSERFEGAGLPAGVYLARLETPAGVRTLRFVRLR